MQFLYPGFLWALLSVAIPILIHLFYFRRFKKVYFSNVRYLKEIKEETSNRNKLKNLLVLMARCLALAALVFAFSQPFIPQNDAVRTGRNHVSVFIDNSFSMSAEKDNVPILDYAKERAAEIIRTYSDEDKFQIITNDFEGKHMRFVSKEDALLYVDNVQTTPSVKTIAEVTERQRQVFNTVQGNKLSYLISDFQKSISALPADMDTTIEINLLPMQALQKKNISIDSVWFEGPLPAINQPNSLLVRIKNNSDELAEQIKLSVRTGDQEKPIGIIDIPGNESIVDTVSFSAEKSGWTEARIKISDYPVQFDDSYYISFYVPDTIKTLIISDGQQNKYVNALFSGLSNFSVSNQSLSQIKYQSFKENNLIILNDVRSVSSGLSEELHQYIQSGGNVLVFPALNADLNNYNTFLARCGADRITEMVKKRREVSAVNTEEYVFADVFQSVSGNLKMPVTQSSANFVKTSSSIQEKLLVFRDGGAFVSKYQVDKGNLFICSSSLNEDENDLVFNAEFFVPMIYKMALSSSGRAQLAYRISNQVVIETENKRSAGDFVYKISQGTTEYIPVQKTAGNTAVLEIMDPLRNAGFYTLQLNQDTIATLAFNFNRTESDLRVFSESELSEMCENRKSLKLIDNVLQANIAETVSEKDKGIVLWKWFIVIALLFLLVESLLIRFFRVQ